LGEHSALSNGISRHGRSAVLRSRLRFISRLWRIRQPPEAALSVIVSLIYAAAAVGIGVYMIAALVRPDKF